METSKFFEVYPFIFLFDLLRYLIPAGAAFLFFWVIFRKRWSHLFIQNSCPTKAQVLSEIKYSLSTVVIFSLTGFGIFTANRIGYIKVYGNIAEYGWAYFFVSLIIMIIFHDFYFYWTHRLMHHRRLFKYIHKVHHESTNPSPWAAYSFHPFEAIIQVMVLPIILIFLPLHGLTIFLFTSYMIIQNVRGHLGYEMLPKAFIRSKLFNWNLTTVHHNMHHKYFNSNYGLYFTWWDKWMNSNHKAYEQTFEEVTSRQPEGKTQSGTSKQITTLLILITLTVPAFSQSPEGTWITFDESTGNPLSQIKIENTPAGMEGKIIQIILQPNQGEDPVCSKCEDARRNKKVIGMEFLSGFKKSGTEWTGGKILDPSSGELYESRLWLENDNTLMVRGYGGPLGLFHRTQTWKRDESTTNTKSPEGTWQTIDDHWKKIKSLVEIKIIDGELKATIKKIYLLPNEGSDPICTECKGELKGRKIVGMKMLWGFTKQGDGWTRGKILDPGNGSTYSSSMWLIDKDTLKVRGYLGPFYRSQVWKRVVAGQVSR
jgi:Delta7-sterol 5-desaturase